MVPVSARFLCFAPEVGSTVFLQLTQIWTTGYSIGNVLNLASVRFQAETLLGKFMRCVEGSWRYGPDFEQTLQIGDVISATVISVGKEDRQDMAIDVIPGEEMCVVGGQDKQMVQLQQTKEEKKKKKKKRKVEVKEEK